MDREKKGFNNIIMKIHHTDSVTQHLHLSKQRVSLSSLYLVKKVLKKVLKKLLL